MELDTVLVVVSVMLLNQGDTDTCYQRNGGFICVYDTDSTGFLRELR